ncbi:MAG TPA: FliG C-terminal domain-containing protein, partial [Gemmatales bacterium]|nr:FliG C-terminal domain-containing protein [Gemmatales bacterium]
EQIEGAGPELGVSIRNLMFVFEDMLLIDQMAMREVLSRTDKKVLTVALNGPNAGRVIGQRLRTPQGQDVWSVEIDEYQTLHGYIVPRRVKLRAPQEKLELRLKLDRAAVNPTNLMAGKTGNCFVRPPSGQEVDLAKYTPPQP